MINQLCDRDILTQLSKNDTTAFEYIYRLYSDQLLVHAHMMLRDTYITEDLVHEVFVKLWQKRALMDPDTNLRFWLHACVRNRVLDYIRRERVRGNHLELIARYTPAGECTADDNILLEEVIDRIDQTISNMPVRMRETFELSWREQLSLEEIAAKTSTSVHTVRKQIQIAVKILRKKLHPILKTTIASICLIKHLLQ